MRKQVSFSDGPPPFEKGGQGRIDDAFRTSHKKDDPHPEFSVKIPASPLQEEVNVGRALTSGAKYLATSETPLLDARILLKHVLSIGDAELIARAREMLAPQAAEQFNALLMRRAQSEPVAYITGAKEFWSLNFKVTPDVLIPRDDSGALIEAVLARRNKNESLRIADLGTGSGCLLCALLTEFSSSRGVGVDLSPAALAVARENANALGLADRAQFVDGNWLAPLAGVFDLIIANPPYIPDGDREGLSRDVVAFEPEGALFAGADGLGAYREIITQLPSRLANDGLMIMECGAGQADSLASMLGEIAGDAALFTIRDLAARPRGAGFDRRQRVKSGQKKD
jgi:release factor glutamine methyltransferase